LKTLRKTDALEPSIDGNFAGNGLVSTKLSGPVRRSQGVGQDQLYILTDGLAGTDVRRGDPVISRRSSARSKGWTAYCRRKLPGNHDPGRMDREIGLCVWDCGTEYVLDFRPQPCFSAVVECRGTLSQLTNLWKIRHHEWIHLLLDNCWGKRMHRRRAWFVNRARSAWSALIKRVSPLSALPGA
jgi:hypothetical protein